MDLATLMGMQNLQSGGGMGALPQPTRTGLLLYGLGDVLRGGDGRGTIALGGSMMESAEERRKKAAEAAARARADEQWASLNGGAASGGTSPFNPAGSARAAPVGAPEMSGGMTPKGIATDALVAVGGKAPGSQYRDAIASIESAGSGGYAAVGPTHPKLGRALGKYQVMESNIGPWSREVLGREVTPEQFLATPQIQDAIFDAKFGKYVERFGPEGAAQAWFSGPGGVGDMGRRDALGTTNADYTRKFNAARGQGQPAPPGLLPPQTVSSLEAIMANPDQPAQRRELARMRLNRHYGAVDQQFEMQQDDQGTSLRQNVEWIMSQNPGMTFDEALGMAKGGITVNTGSQGPQVGTIPQGYQLVPGQDGSYRMEPIPGGPAAREQEEQARKRSRATEGQARNETNRRDVVLETTGAIRDMLDRTGLFDLPEVGILGSRLTGVNQEAADMAGMLDTLKGMVAFDRLDKLRQASATGASGLGQVTEREISLLAAQLGALDQTLSPDRIRSTLDTIEGVFGRLSPAARDYLMGQGGGEIPEDGFASREPSSRSGATSGSSGKRLRYNPETGRLE